VDSATELEADYIKGCTQLKGSGWDPLAMKMCFEPGVIWPLDWCMEMSVVLHTQTRAQMKGRGLGH